MSTSVGSIHYNVGLDTAKFDAAVEGVNAKVSTLGDKFNGAANTLGAFAKTAGVAMAAAGVAVGALTGKMLMSGAELEQQLGGAEAVFGQFADGIKQKAEDAYFQAGLSQQEFLQGANKMGSLFQGAGFSVQQSMQMSADSMQRASDIASIMGISTTEALEAVAGMAKGNFTMMDNLGVAMNDTAIAAYAASKGIDASIGSMTIQQKVGLAQQMFMEKTAKYAGNYAKENQTLAGSLNSTKKAFDNLLAGQGDVSGFIELLVNTMEIAVPQIMAILPKIIEGFTAVMKALVPALSSAIPIILPAFINTITSLLNALVAAFPSVMQTLLGALPSIIDGFIKLFLAIVYALPQIITTIAQAMPTIITALVNGLTNPTAIQALILGSIQLLIAIIRAIPIIIPALIDAIPLIIRNLVAVLTSPPFISAMVGAAVQLMRALVGGIIRSVGDVANAAWNVIRTIGSILSPGGLYNIGRDVIQGLINGINSNAGAVVNRVKDIARGALDEVKKFFGIKSPSRLMAKQGNYIMQGLGVGIDKGARAVVSTAADAMSMLGNQLTARQQIDMMMNAGSQSTMSAANAGAFAGQSAVNTYIYGDTILNGETDQQAYMDRLARNFLINNRGATV